MYRSGVTAHSYKTTYEVSRFTPLAPSSHVGCPQFGIAVAEENLHEVTPSTIKKASKSRRISRSEKQNSPDHEVDIALGGEVVLGQQLYILAISGSPVPPLRWSFVRWRVPCEAGWGEPCWKEL